MSVGNSMNTIDQRLQGGSNNSARENIRFASSIGASRSTDAI